MVITAAVYLAPMHELSVGVKFESKHVAKARTQISAVVKAKLWIIHQSVLQEYSARLAYGRESVRGKLSQEERTAIAKKAAAERWRQWLQGLIQ